MESFARTHVQAQSKNDVQGVYLSPSFTSPMLLLLEILTLVLEGSTQQTSQPNTPKNSKETGFGRKFLRTELLHVSI